MVKRLTHRILTPTFMGSIPITPVYVKYFAVVGSNPTRAVWILNVFHFGILLS